MGGREAGSPSVEDTHADLGNYCQGHSPSASVSCATWEMSHWSHGGKSECQDHACPGDRKQPTACGTVCSGAVEGPLKSLFGLGFWKTSGVAPA